MVSEYSGQNMGIQAITNHYHPNSILMNINLSRDFLCSLIFNKLFLMNKLNL